MSVAPPCSTHAHPAGMLAASAQNGTSKPACAAASPTSANPPLPACLPLPSSAAGFFLKMFSGARCGLNDLPTLDPDMYRNLLRLRDHFAQPGASSADLALTFTVDAAVGFSGFGGDASSSSMVEEVELKPGGRNIPVTAENVQEYIHRMANYK